MADTAVERMVVSGRPEVTYRPQLLTCFQRKLLSPCHDFGSDFLLHCFWYDTMLAKRLSALVAIADSKRVSADSIAADMQLFRPFWRSQLAKLEDMCRLRGSFPNLFVTVAPAEWTFPLHVFLLDKTRLSDAQFLLTRHLYHVLVQGLERLLGNLVPTATTGIACCHEWCMRFEFQKRGTLHVHVIAWITPLGLANDLNGRTGQTHSSLLVTYLETLFRGSVDVQSGDGHECLLQYVAGYIAKGSDSLQLPDGDATSAWRQVFRMMTQSCPLWQEMAIELSALPLVRQSFPSLTFHAPLPASPSKHKGHDALLYVAYLQRPAADEEMSLLHWLRMRVVKVQAGEASVTSTRARPAAVGVVFPFELKDIFCGTFLAMFVPHRDPGQLTCPPTLQPRLPLTAHYFWCACNHAFFEGTFDGFLTAVLADFTIRGFNLDRRYNFEAHAQAKYLLLQAALRGNVEAQCWVPPSRPSMVCPLVLHTRIVALALWHLCLSFCCHDLPYFSHDCCSGPHAVVSRTNVCVAHH